MLYQKILLWEAFKEDKDLLNFSYLNIYKTLNNESIKVLETLYLIKRIKFIHNL